ncbi:DC-STAMP domain-containing protein 2-like [Hetaerina americana]|uniref:DC-STAMP domain-containing protein 2-like n=1 Tax=Hetaerina americana TaxID=62018 RepID=UPI003A7F2C61
MRFFISVIKAHKIEKKRRHLERERLNSIRIHSKEATKTSLTDWFMRCTDWRNWPCFIPCIRLPNFIKFVSRKLLGEEGTFRNFVLKSLVGFLCGIFLSYLFLIFLIFQLNFKISTATGYSSALVIFLSIGMAFSEKIRCFVLLLLPTLFSKRGRQALLAYAIVLALAGPARNVLHNVDVLSQSLACSQEKLKGAAGDAVNMVKQPLKAIKDAIKKVTQSIKDAVEKTKKIILNIFRVIKNILKMIKSAFQWIASVANICNRKLGPPSERCIRSFAASVDDCVVKLGPLFSWMCSIAKLASLLCHILKILDKICEFIHFVGEKVVGYVKQKFESLGRQLHDAFYVKVTFSHSFHFQTQSSTSMGQVIKGIVSEVKERTSILSSVFGWMGLATSFCFLLVFIRVLQYSYKYQVSDKFDNHYISHHIYEIDARRMAQDRETILPLKHHEKRKYIKVTSLQLTGSEKMKITKSSMVIFLATVKLATYIATDHCLYWLLGIIRKYGNIQTQLPAPNMIGVHVEGKGPLANLYQGTINALQPLGMPPSIDTSACLPVPRTPDVNCHYQIVGLLVLCWMLTLTEPYGQRMRAMVMNAYYPKRAYVRAAWLYNQILRSRLSFLKFTRRQLRRKFAGQKGRGEDGQTMENVTISQRLAALFPRLNFIFGPSKNEKMCILCGAVGSVERKENQEYLITCKTLGCKGVFCEKCFSEMHNICTLCKEPAEYGDLSDVSEEKDSSDDPDSIIEKLSKERKISEIHNKGEGATSMVYADGEQTDTSLSYGYQDSGAESSPLLTPVVQRHFRDVEKQSILDLEGDSGVGLKKS